MLCVDLVSSPTYMFASKLLKEEDAPPSLLKALEDSLVLVHGGQSMNVGPVLEMVTEKYYLWYIII